MQAAGVWCLMSVCLRNREVRALVPLYIGRDKTFGAPASCTEVMLHK